MNRLRRALCALILLFGITASGGCATITLPRMRHETFQQLSGPPTVYVVSPVLNVTSPFIWMSREVLTQHVDKVHQELLEEMVAEFERKGYRASGQLIAFDELPQDRREEVFRDVVLEAYQEYSHMGAILIGNLQQEKDKPLDYRLGRVTEELAGLLPTRPDWLFFSNTSAHVSGILPYSEHKTLGLLMGIGLVPPGEDAIFQRGALVDARTGEVLWFNFIHLGAHSLVFPSSRQGTIRAFLKELPAPNQPGPRATSEASS